MAINPTPPIYNQDPYQKPNDVPVPTMPPGVFTKPKPSPQQPPMPQPAPPRPQGGYGSSDGSGFNLQAWLQGNRRQRPNTTNILPGQGQGPMPIGTRPLPEPKVNGGFRGNPNDVPRQDEQWIGGVMMAPDGNGGYYNSNAPNGRSGAPAMGGWNGQLTPGTPEYGDWVRRMKMQHGEGWTPDGGGGMPMPPQGVGGGVNVGQKPQFATQWQGGERNIGQDPMAGGAPAGGGAPAPGGRQPLREGYHYSPHGGQRPNAPGGGIQGHPQDGGQSQMDPRMQDAYNQWQQQNPGQAPMSPEEHAQWSNGVGQNQVANQNDWRNRFRGGSSYYGAF